MKKIIRILLITTVAVLALCCVALAAETPVVTVAEGVNAVVTLQEGNEKLDATFNDAAIPAGGEYMFFMVKANASGAYIPGETTVIYMNQVSATAAGSVTITGMFPMEITDCAVMVSGTGLAAPKIIAYVTLEEDSVLLGDVNADKYIDSGDAMLLKQHTASLIALDAAALKAGEVSGDGYTDSADAMYILQYAVSLITKFPAQA